MSTVYQIVPSRYRYQGRHRKAEALSRRFARSAAGFTLTVVWLGFATLGVISAVLPR